MAPKASPPSPHGRSHRAGIVSTVSGRRSQKLTLSTNQSPMWREKKASRPRVGCKLWVRKGHFYSYSMWETRKKLDPCCYCGFTSQSTELSGICKHRRIKTDQGTLLAGNKSDNQGWSSLWQLICRKMMLGTSALHMAASPAEDNTERTKTATPDW